MTCSGLFGYSLPSPRRARRAKSEACFRVKAGIGPSAGPGGDAARETRNGEDRKATRAGMRVIERPAFTGRASSGRPHGPMSSPPGPGSSEDRRPQLGEDLADLREQVVAVGPLERMDVGAIPALVPVVPGDGRGRERDRPDGREEVRVEEEREREPVARGR